IAPRPACGRLRTLGGRAGRGRCGGRRLVSYRHAASNAPIMSFEEANLFRGDWPVTGWPSEGLIFTRAGSSAVAGTVCRQPGVRVGLGYPEQGGAPAPHSVNPCLLRTPFT